MADSSSNTTVWVVAAVAIVAVLWSKRSMATPRPGPYAGTSGARSFGSSGGLRGSDYEGIGKGLSSLISGIGGLFSGHSDAGAATHNSDPNAAYTIPTTPQDDPYAPDASCPGGYVADVDGINDGMPICRVS